MKISKQEHNDAMRQLSDLKPGDTVYCVLRNVSRSGMSRSIDLYVMRENQPCSITWAASRVLGYSIDRKNEGLKVGGCEMDMGFHTVYSLSRRLFPDGFAPSELGIRPDDGKLVNVNIGRGRNAGPMRREEMAALVAKGWVFPGGRNNDSSGWDDDGGYALKHRWM